jgi:hypothetical protein
MRKKAENLFGDLAPVLPDGVFIDQKSQFGYILEGLAMEDVGILETFNLFTAKWNILWPFGAFCGHFVHFVVLWYILTSFGKLCREKSGNPVAAQLLV